MSRLKCSLLVLFITAFAAACSKGKQDNTPPPPPSVTQQNQQPAVQPVPPEPPPEAVSSTPSRELPARSETSAPRKLRSNKKPVSPREEPQQTGSAQMQQPVQPNPEIASPAPAPAPAPSRSVAENPAPPVRQPRFVTIPSGTPLHVRLQDALDTGVNKSGDTFHAILDQDLRINGSLVAPRGSVAEGKLTQVDPSGRFEGRASMSIQLISLVIDRQTYPVQTEILSFEGDSVGKKTVTKVGAGAGLGAIIGAIVGGGKGAAIGAAAGAGAGGATAAATNKKELRFEAEHQLSFALSRDMEVKLQ
jgi:hypothetical protein